MSDISVDWLNGPYYGSVVDLQGRLEEYSETEGLPSSEWQKLGGPLSRCSINQMGWKIIEGGFYEKRGAVKLQLTGEPCQRLGALGVLRLRDFLGTVGGFEANRLDVALDTTKISVAVVRGLVDTCMMSRRYRGPVDSREGNVTFLENGRGKTLNFGTHASDVMLCIYDAHGPTRIEQRYTGRCCRMVNDYLLQLGRSWEKMGVDVVKGLVGLVDFRRRESAKDDSRGVRVPEWEAVVSDSVAWKIPQAEKRLLPTVYHQWEEWILRNRKWLMVTLESGRFGDLQDKVRELLRGDELEPVAERRLDFALLSGLRESLCVDGGVDVPF
jgi:hypothetical protein